MFVIHPRRHDEDVALLPVEALAVDDRMALSLGALIDEAAGLAVRLCALAGAQQLHRRADGRHAGSPGGRVHIIHDAAVIGRTVRWLRVPDESLMGRSEGSRWGNEVDSTSRARRGR